MVRLLYSTVFLCCSLLAVLQDVVAEQSTSMDEIMEPSNSVKPRILASSRFWGKRADAIKNKVAGSRIFWGKRSSPMTIEDVWNMERNPKDTFSELGDNEVAPEVLFADGMPQTRVAKGSLPPKLKISSRFWGRR